MIFSNGLNSYGLTDFNNAIQAATNVQVGYDQQVIDLAKQINQMNIGFLTQQANKAQQVIQPFVQMGTNAGNALSALLGIGSGSSGSSALPEGTVQGTNYFNPENNQYYNIPTNQINNIPGAAGYTGTEAALLKNPALNSGGSQTLAYTPSAQMMANYGITTSPTYNAYNGNINPTSGQAYSTQGGQGAGSNGQMGALNNMLNSPMIQSQLQFGLEGVQNQLAGQGLSGSGAAMKQLQSYGQGIAANQIGNYEQALGTLFTGGAQAAGQSANMFNQLGTQVAQQNTQMGNTQSNALLNMGQVQSQGIMSQAQMSLMAAMGGLGGLGGGAQGDFGAMAGGGAGAGLLGMGLGFLL